MSDPITQEKALEVVEHVREIEEAWRRVRTARPHNAVERVTAFRELMERLDENLEELEGDE